MTARICYLPGDGVGPEVGAAALAVLDAAARRFGFAVAIEERLFGGAAIDATGSPFPAETRAAALGADAVLLGAVGGPAWDALPGDRRPERGLLDLRAALGVFANLRPIRPHPRAAAASPLKPERLAGVDFLVVRELTGGLYFGEKRREGDRASDLCVYTADEIARVTRKAAALARTRRGRLASIDKANVLETSRLWRETVSRVMAAEFPDVALEHGLVDACAMRLLTQPTAYDVILTENLFGDILTDEAAVLLGSIGLAPSASLGADGRGLYEPIHGSAPDIAGRGLANPLGMILSVALMLRWSLARPEAAAAIEAAVDAVLESGPWPRDLGGDASTGDVAEAVVGRLG